MRRSVLSQFEKLLSVVARHAGAGEAVGDGGAVGIFVPFLVPRRCRPQHGERYVTKAREDGIRARRVK